MFYYHDRHEESRPTSGMYSTIHDYLDLIYNESQQRQSNTYEEIEEVEDVDIGYKSLEANNMVLNVYKSPGRIIFNILLNKTKNSKHKLVIINSQTDGRR